MTTASKSCERRKGKSVSGNKSLNILVTGASGFVGKNLCCALKNIRAGKDRTHPNLSIGEIFEYTRACTENDLARFCAEADFVFNLAGVNRPKDAGEFMEGNFGFAGELLAALRAAGNTCPVMLSSSAQASLEGRYAASDYGKSKLAGEELFFAYAAETGARALVYRFPNVFGKWCRPNYNSAVATFCHNIANSLPITVNDPATELELVYIDDLVDELLLALEGREHRCDYAGLTPLPADGGRWCYVPTTHRATLGRISELLYSFAKQPRTLIMPEIPDGSFEKKLYSTYLSYLPKEKTAQTLKMNVDMRGSFTELIKSEKCGQMSVNISKPGVTKGQHWHNSKWELFIVVHGTALIRERCLATGETVEFTVSGEHIEAVHMIPGWTHSITNLSETDELVTVMTCNEVFDPARPDTFFEPV